jgi:hypothetical protein
MNRQPQNLPPTTWQARLKGFVGGGILVALGYWQMAHGIHVFIGRRYGQPVFSYSAVAAGVIVILVSLAPARLIVKMTALKKYRPYRANAAEQRAGGALTEAAKPK